MIYVDIENGTAIIPKECRPMTVPSLIGTASGDRVETSTASPMTKAASPMKSSDSPTNHNGRCDGPMMRIVLKQSDVQAPTGLQLCTLSPLMLCFG